MKSLATAILVTIAAISSDAQEGRWIGEHRSMSFSSNGSFRVTINVDPEGELLRELAAIADSANIEPVIAIWTSVGGEWSAQGDSLHLQVIRWEILADRGNEIKNFLDIMRDFTQELAAEIATRENLSDEERDTLAAVLYNDIVGNSWQYLSDVPQTLTGFYDREREILNIEGLEFRRPGATAVRNKSWGEIKREMR